MWVGDRGMLDLQGNCRGTRWGQGGKGGFTYICKAAQKILTEILINRYPEVLFNNLVDGV